MVTYITIKVISILCILIFIRYYLIKNWGQVFYHIKYMYSLFANDGFELQNFHFHQKMQTLTHFQHSICRTSASPRTRLPRIRGYSAEITQPYGAYNNFHPEENIMKGKDINLITLPVHTVIRSECIRKKETLRRKLVEFR